MIWALGRIGSRVPMNGNAQSTVSTNCVADWLHELFKLQLDDVKALPLSVMQMARCTDDRLTDLPQKTRDEAIKYLKEMGGHDPLIELIQQAGKADHDLRNAIFGEQLPLGLSANLV